MYLRKKYLGAYQVLDGQWLSLLLPNNIQYYFLFLIKAHISNNRLRVLKYLLDT